MVAKEFYSGISLEEIGDEETTLIQNSRDDPDADADAESEVEEALSLCDLPLYNNNSSISAEWDGNNFSKEEDDDDDFFEFFSEDFTTSTNSTTHHHHNHHRTVSDNIIFCGKLIPFKDTTDHDESCNNIIQKGNNKNTLVPWRSNSSSISSTSKGSSNNFSSYTSCEYSSSSIGKVSLLRSPTKSRWFLFMFGMPRLSTNTGNMELREIRSRQSRNSRRTKLAAAVTSPEKMMKEGRSGGSCNKGLWKVLRSMVGLGCRSSKLANDVVKAAFV